jgi:hypothetical protein
MNKDIIEYIGGYLVNRDLFNWLTINKEMYKYIEVYRKKYRFDYDKIKKNKGDYRKIIIKGEIYKEETNILKKIYNYCMGEEYYLVKEILYYLSNASYEIKKIRKMRIDLMEYKNLESIEYDYYYDQEIEYKIPLNVKHIKFGRYFNKSIDNLPDNIENIEFEEQSIFNIEIKKYPSKLKKIKYGYNFTGNIDNLPDGVREINMKHNLINYSDINKLPSEIEKIWINMNNIKCNIKKEMIIYYNRYINIKDYGCKMIAY